MTGPATDDYPRAAQKHLHDAMVLEAAGRCDGAAYLAGYVVECAAKTLIQVETGQVRPTHELNELRETLNALASFADARTARLGVAMVMLLESARILDWRPQMRYRPPEVSERQARSWLREALAIYSLVIGGLAMDGLIG